MPEIAKQRKVSLTVDQKVAILTISNPPVNALDEQVIREMEEVISQLRESDDVGVVIVTGAGEKAFVAGADIRQFSGLDRTAGEQLARNGQEVFNKLSQIPFPVICAVNGFALGGGCELALACDIRVVAENAKLGLPEVSLAIIPGYGGTQRLPRVVGVGKAMDLILTGDPITAEEAYRIGLADRLVKPGEALSEAQNMAKRILSRGPLAVMSAKKAIQHGIQKSFAEGLQLEANLFGFLCESQDKEEGAKAFLQKRQPEFQGK
jgi:enoyl-CoA hydratase